MRSWLFPPVAAPARAVEATPQQVIATGAAGAAYSVDPVDGERGWRPAGSGGHREVPWWTTERARIYSVAAYRSNPMARAIVDTYTAFCVGDSGVSYQATNPEVAVVVDQFWNDPRVMLGGLQERLLRDHMLMGETALQLLVGELSGVTRFSPAPVSQISDVRFAGGNPLWPAELIFGSGTGDGLVLPVVAVNDLTNLREGKVMWWRSWMALLDDHRGDPFLTPILDHLDSYDSVISNLIDRTALARYLVWDVTVKGEQPAVDAFVKARGGLHVPPSGSVEVHNESVTWEPKTAQTGAEEDSIAGKNVLTLVAGGAGLAKTWLAEPDGANRATSLSMAEPVRRRVGGVQRLWLSYQTELVRYAVDQAVRARRLPQMVTARDPRTGREFPIPAAQSVTVTGPSISASDAEFTAKILLNLSTGLEKLVQSKVLSPEAARIAARKAWEDYMGVPYTADLDSPDANPDDVAQAVDDAARKDAEARGRHRAYDPDQPRDGLGKWSKTPGGRPPLPRRRDRPGVGQPTTSRPSARHLLDTGRAGEFDRLQQEWASVLDGSYAGLTVRTTGSSAFDWTPQPDGPEYPVVMANADILDANGDHVGSLTRGISEDDTEAYALHAMLSIDDPELQGAGFARAFNSHLEDWYRQAGIRRIELEANIDVGGYAWARSGYDFKTPAAALKIMGRLEEFLGRAERGALDIPEDRIDAQIEAAEALLERIRTAAFGSVDYPSAYEVSQLGRWPGAGRDDVWIGKATLLGSSWEGVKPL
ncbi:hypothetical protein AB0M91_09305 [Micromonospora rifamycinica]|uniref:hypothetical protein n=1 Tax=Micromonospora rifamycinica TaxID=291594 RepID=UPI00341BD472